MQSRQTEREIVAFYDGQRFCFDDLYETLSDTCRIWPSHLRERREKIDEAERTELELFRRQHGTSSIVGETLQGSGEMD